MNFNAELYSPSFIPLESVKIFLDETLSKLYWNKSDEEEVVLDVGCGPGGTTSSLVLPLFPKLKKVFAIDIMQEMIDLARRKNSHPLIEYNVASIEDWSTVKHFEGKITKTVSIHCFQWLKNQLKAFQNIFRLLKTGGEAVIVLVLQSSFFATVLEMQNNPKWIQYFQDIDNCVADSHLNNHKTPYYKKMLEDIGFEILYSKEEVKIDVFASTEDYKRFFSSICVLVSYIPDAQKEEFKNDFIQALLKKNGLQNIGLPFHTGNMLELIIRKKINNIP
ncbi:Juvenile hormone acid O-methyltransferase [Araneus ventricosus]|uniref:Juvenile hormone acid O-methyltransferase n=1 Tax=Araneus ventricosus TaxID=182803 RepID=A0A4Y2UMY0_ARAVE|nr:Juvenile hormone acid O-methyltransferase [Araneus ventricosus]